MNLKLLKASLFFLCILGLNGNAISAVYTDTEGRSIQLANKSNKWLIINYWASWCKPCYDEIPEINAFYHANKKNKIIVVGVNYDFADQTTLKQLISKMGIQFPVLTTDPASDLSIANIPVLPATYIFSPKGELVKELYGSQTQKHLEEIMAELRNSR